MLIKYFNEFKQKNSLAEEDGKIITAAKIEMRLSQNGKSIDLIKYIDGYKFAGQILQDEQNKEMLYLTPENEDGNFVYADTLDELVDVFLSL